MAWEQLSGMIREAEEIDRQDRSGTPVSCPHDYVALVAGPGGEEQLICPWDGTAWPRDASSWGEFPGSY